jgi:hypothetical protein
MSIASHDLRLLEHLLKEEAETLETLSTLEDKLRHSVMGREWDSIDNAIRDVQTISEKVTQTEQVRAVVYQKIKRSCQAKPEEGFQDIMARVPVEEQGNLPALHRRVRTAVEKIKCLTVGLDTYVNSAAGTMDKILEELFPDRRNKIYTRGGETLASSRPVMISQSL